jgi:hypothetical protein
LVKRGEIYLDKKFKYPAGNIDVKYILILNKSYYTGDPIFVATATTKFDKTKNKPGCNHRVYAFYLKSNEDFFPEDTLLQLSILNYPIEESVFLHKKNDGDIDFRAIMNEETINRIVKCIKEIRNDITSKFHGFLF